MADRRKIRSSRPAYLKCRWVSEIGNASQLVFHDDIVPLIIDLTLPDAAVVLSVKHRKLPQEVS